MTSVIRQRATPVKTVTRFHRIETPCYTDSVLSIDIPFPFTYNNGTLDINLINNFEADMITTTGIDPSEKPDCSFRLLGGSRLVQSLGPNFIAYITAWRTGRDAGTPISIYINCTVQRAQWVNEGYIDDDIYAVSTTPPSGDLYITSADAVPTYNTVWIFNSPLTITTVEGGVTQYITFASRLDED